LDARAIQKSPFFDLPSAFASPSSRKICVKVEVRDRNAVPAATRSYHRYKTLSGLLAVASLFGDKIRPIFSHAMDSLQFKPVEGLRRSIS
jgi:hypothetical protein